MQEHARLHEPSSVGGANPRCWARHPLLDACLQGLNAFSITHSQAHALPPPPHHHHPLALPCVTLLCVSGWS